MPNDNLRKQLEPIIPKLFEDHPRSTEEYWYDVRFLYREGKLHKVQRIYGEHTVRFESKQGKIDYLG